MVKTHLPVTGDTGQRFDPWVGKIPGGGHNNPLQYSCLENPMDRGVWKATVDGVAKSRTRLKRLSSSSRFVIAFLPWSKCLLISWLHSTSSVILGPKKIKSVTVSTFSPSVHHEVMEPML